MSKTADRAHGIIFGKLSTIIPHQENNFFVVIPKDPSKWAEAMNKSKEEELGVEMYVDLIAHGCGACAIWFSPYDQSRSYDKLDDGETFGIVVDKETLGAIKRMIDFAYENFDGEVSPPR